MQSDTSDQGMLASAADSVTLAHHVKIYTCTPSFYISTTWLGNYIPSYSSQLIYLNIKKSQYPYPLSGLERKHGLMKMSGLLDRGGSNPRKPLSLCDP